MVSKSIGFRRRWTLAPEQGTTFPSSVAMPRRPSIFPLRSAALATTWARISLRKIGLPSIAEWSPQWVGGLLHLVGCAAGLDEEYSDSVMPDGQRFSDTSLREDRGKIVGLRQGRDRNVRCGHRSHLRIEGDSTASRHHPAAMRPSPCVWRVRVAAAARGRRRRLSALPSDSTGSPAPDGGAHSRGCECATVRYTAVGSCW